MTFGLQAQNEAEIKADGIIFPKLSTYPSTPELGQVIYYVPNSRFEYNDGSSWQPLDTAGDQGSIEIIEDSVDGDSYVRAIEFGGTDYVRIDVENSPAIQVWQSPGNTPRIEFNGPNDNVVLGNNAGDAINGASANTIIGDAAGGDLTTGNDNVLIGRLAGLGLTTQSGNVFIGRQAGFENEEKDNTFIGYRAGADSPSALNSVFIGFEAGESSDGVEQVCIGHGSGKSLDASSLQNTFVGSTTGANSTDAWWNTFIGSRSGRVNITGDGNTFIGTSAGENNSAGGGNTFLGRNAGINSNGNTNSQNVFLGAGAGAEADGSDNVFVGSGSGNTHSTGIRNTFLGASSGGGGASQSGSNNVYLGYAAGRNKSESDRLRISNELNAIPLIFGQFNTDRVGINTEDLTANLTIQQSGSGEEALRLVNDNNDNDWAFEVYTTQLGVIYNGIGVGTFSSNGLYDDSDRRLKHSIESMAEGALEKILQLKPSSYFYKNRDDQSGRSFGFIAQDLLDVFPECVQISETEAKTYQVRYNDFIPLTVKAMQEQQHIINDMESEYKDLKSKYEDLEKKIEQLMSEIKK